MTNRLTDMIRDAGHTQATIAEALGVTQATVSRKINGDSAWRVNELTQLAQMLNTTPADVLDAATEAEPTSRSRARRRKGRAA